jgi:tRNA threonylcarbamoyl adenosine modification protein YeaZ
MSGELVLGIDTTGRGGAVALATDSGVLGREVHDPALGYAEELFGLLDRLLAATRRDRSDLGGVAVLEGPGSFTGLRIGVMTAKTLAFALDVPLWAAPTLDLLAAAAGRGSWLALTDAGGGHYWSREVDVGPEDVAARGPAQRIGPDALPDDRSRVVSMAPVAVGRALDDLAGPLAWFAARGATPARRVDPLALTPDYVSISQAERTHGVDLTEQIERPIRPRSWDP